MIQEIAAGIIIYRNTPKGLKFLILYHGNNYWNFPKGKIESEEKSFHAAVREVREETGLSRNDLRFNSYFKTSERFTFTRQVGEEKMKVFKIVMFYLAETRKSQIRISSEHEGYGWFTYREATKILGKKRDNQRVLAQAYEFLQKQRRQEARRRPQVQQVQQQPNFQGSRVRGSETDSQGQSENL